MNKLYQLEFISPVNKGEKFTFEKLLSLEENQKEFEKQIQIEINSKKSELESQIRGELSIEFDKQKNLLIKKSEIEVQEKILDYKKEKIEEIASLKKQIEAFENSKKEILESKEKQIESLEKNINEMKNSFLKDKEEFKDTLKKIQEKQEKDKEDYKVSLDKEREGHQETLKKYENQVEKRIQDAVSRTQEELTRRRTSAVAIGDIGEQQIRDTLKQLFSHDVITKPDEHSGGADIDHLIKDGNKTIGSILYEIKNKTSWQKMDYQRFVEKVNKSEHNYFIYVHNKLVKEKGEGDFYKIASNLTFDNRNKIFITNFESVVSLVYILREVMVEYSKKIELSKNKISIAEKIFEFIKSNDFKNYFTRAEEKRAAAELYFEKIVEQATKGKAELFSLKSELGELYMRINEEA